MSQLSYIITGTGITAVIDGETMTITRDNPSYGQVLDAIKEGDEPWRIAELFRAANAIAIDCTGTIMRRRERAPDISCNDRTCSSKNHHRRAPRPPLHEKAAASMCGNHASSRSSSRSRS